MQTHCPSCGAPIAAEDVNHRTQQAHCRSCNKDFSIGTTVRSEMANRLRERGFGDGLLPGAASIGSPSGNRRGGAPPIWFGAIFASAGLLFVAIGLSLVILQRYRIATYQPIAAVVRSSSVRSHASSGRHGGTTYEPVISYTYVVDGHQFTSNHVMPGVVGSSSSSWAQRTINQYRPRTKTTAWYCPSDPTKAFLIHQLDEGPYIFALGPALFAAIGIGLMLGGVHAGRPVATPTADSRGWFHLREQGTIRGRFRIAAAATLIWYAYCGALLGDYAHVNGPDQFVYITSAIALVMGLIGLIPAWRYWRLCHEFLDADISISQQQLRPGDTIQFRVRQGILQPMEIEKLSIGIVCLRDDRTKYGNKTSYSTDEAWSHWVDLPVSRNYSAGGTIDVQGELPVGAFVAPSSPHRGWQYPRFRWHIGLKVYPQSMKPLVVRFPIMVTANDLTPPSAQVAPAAPMDAGG